MKHLFYFLIVTFLLPQLIIAQEPGTFRNPVIPGFNPDPSICRVGEDYYVSTSSFEYFPAFPIYHSRDLVNWSLVGNILDRPSQINLEQIRPSDGLFSPTLRFHNGLYYTTYTLLRYEPKQHITNWLVTASDAKGPWSDPVCIIDEPLWRIDPSFFFDDDDKCYFMANSYIPGEEGGHRRRILIQEFDLTTKKLIGAWHEIGRGSTENSGVAEGAHIYKRKGYYYLMIAENFPGRGHTETISRSKSIFGPYEQCPHKPLITVAKNVSPDDIYVHGKAFYSAGHGDLVETPHGEWWMILWACRKKEVLGRETVLVPVEWNEQDWLVVNPNLGYVRFDERLPKGSKGLNENPIFRDEWDSPKLKSCWMFVRVPDREFWSLTVKPGFLQIPLLPATATHPYKTGCPAFISLRLKNHDYDIITKLNFEPTGKNEEAGLLLRRGEVSLALLKGKKDSGNVVRIISLEKNNRKVLVESEAFEKGEIFLKVSCRNETELMFFYSLDNSNWIAVGEKTDGSILGRDAPQGFWTGTTAGIYTSSNGITSNNVASFDFFEMKNFPSD
ncbi:MAG: glycoside hydrolase family 43 protein [Planctomycetaceae bacterium]|jgi:alpha-N-arabinofuranosidase|nr:glycoside hydrolase family 43 protein [Planctomycetaceae bacterium]